MKSFIQRRDALRSATSSPFIGKSSSGGLLSSEKDTNDPFIKPSSSNVGNDSVQTLSSTNSETETLKELNSTRSSETTTLEEQETEAVSASTKTMEKETETATQDIQKKCANCEGEQSTLISDTSTLEEQENEAISKDTKTIEEETETLSDNTRTLEQETETTTATNHCSIQSASFTSIPSGKIAAYYSGGKYGAAFNMKGDFSVNPPCNSAYGEYRQYVRGYFKKNGSTLTHRLCGTNLSPTAYQEDCGVSGGTQYKYGYRNNRFATSYFSPDQAGGHNFVGYDYPGVTATTGDSVDIKLEFIGKLIDTSKGNAVLQSSSWSVEGATTIP